MKAPHVLFISGSIGLGHVTRDLAIAAALREQCPDLRLVWLAADPARQVLRTAGETLVPECDQYAGETRFVETIAGNFSVRLTHPATILASPKAWRGVWQLVRGQKDNVSLFKELTQREHFDLIIGDEIYEIMLAGVLRPSLKRVPMAFIGDFVGVDAVSRNLLERLSVQIMSWWGVRLVKRLPRFFDLVLFAGEEEDVADKPFGLFLPNRRQLAKSLLSYTGYICPFEPADYQDRARLRERLGYGPEPLILCAIGGTSIGKPLLELCGRAHPLIRKHLPNLRMVCVCGPRLAPDTLDLPPEVERTGYVHRLYEHLAACDLAIVQGGGSTTLELTALRRPFIYFPLEGHFEQRQHVAKRIERHGAGVKLEYQQTTPEQLAAVALAQIGTEVRYPPIRTDGARRAARLLGGLWPVAG